MFRNYIYIAVAFIFIISCRAKVCNKTIYCGLALQPVFYGYDSSDVDTVIVFTYADSNFLSLVNQKIYTTPDSVQNYGYPNDTPEYYKYGFDSLYLTGEYGYKIFIPKTSQTFKIYNIGENPSSEIIECDYRGPCQNSYINMTVTGGRYGGSQFFQEAAYIFFYKQ